MSWSCSSKRGDDKFIQNFGADKFLKAGPFEDEE
jgi:hypothetical protein